MENGGSGIIPDGARNNFGKTKPKNSQLMSNLKREFKPFVAEDVKNIPLISLESEFKLPELSSIVEPESSDVLKMFELGKKMMMAGADGVRMKNVDKSRLKMTLSSLEVMLLTSKPLPSSSRSVSKGYDDVNSSHDSRDVRQRSSDDVGGKRSRSRSFTDRSNDDHISQSRHYCIARGITVRERRAPAEAPVRLAEASERVASTPAETPGSGTTVEGTKMRAVSTVASERAAPA